MQRHASIFHMEHKELIHGSFCAQTTFITRNSKRKSMTNSWKLFHIFRTLCSVDLWNREKRNKARNILKIVGKNGKRLRKRKLCFILSIALFYSIRLYIVSMSLFNSLLSTTLWINRNVFNDTFTVDISFSTILIPQQKPATFLC